MQVTNHGSTVSQVAKNRTESPTGTTTANHHGKEVSQVAKQQSAHATSKQIVNTAILAAQQEVNLSASDEPMILLYRAAIEAINEELAPTMGENATQTNYDKGIDFSPEATAERIVDFATNFFSMYQAQNSNMEFDQQLNSFMDVIGGAIEQGFDEAKEILTNLKVLEGDIAEGVEETYELVQSGLQTFRDSFKQTNELEPN